MVLYVIVTISLNREVVLSLIQEAKVLLRHNGKRFLQL